MSAAITINTPIQFNDPLPDIVDVVIIGAGVIGIFSALYLSRLGKKVLVCEKGRVAGEQSSRNWGWIRQHGRDAAELPITTQALQLWHQADAETGGACGIKTVGVHYLASNQKELAYLQQWLEVAKQHDMDSYAMTQAQVNQLFSQPTNGQWLGGTCTPSDAKGEPWQAVPAVAKLAQQEGVLIKENCAVRDLLVEAGKVAGVVTESGEVNASQVVLCGGAWSALFARRLGVNIPQLSVEATVAQTQPMEAGVEASWVDEELSMRRRDDGGYSLALADSHGFFVGPDALRHTPKFMPLLRRSWHDVQFMGLSRQGYPDAWGVQRQWLATEVTPFERQRVLEPPSHAGRVAKLQQRFAQRFPELGKPPIKHSWSGMIDAMPDVVPVVDAVDQIPGFYLATGMSAHGFGIGPGYGRVVARMLAGLPAEHDLQRFRLARFSDGSKIDVGPAL
ncbi:MAG: FAD-binding oxidoreductase [Gammaproteobacteria bacterium]|jgi:glycine/D-amino acid oxidase-like deaminating enzyme|nr:FAD-binding oxidoreductase [Gammaproteobacteria bacterium]